MIDLRPTFSKYYYLVDRSNGNLIIINNQRDMIENRAWRNPNMWKSFSTWPSGSNYGIFKDIEVIYD